MTFANYYAERRLRLISLLENNSLCLIWGAGFITRNQDVEYPFRQDSSFWYVTGYPEAEAALLIYKSPSGQALQTLFILPKNPEQEIWTGLRLDPEQAKELTGIQQIDIQANLKNIIKKYLTKVQTLYLEENGKKFLATQIFAQDTKKILDLQPLIARLRLYKDEYEINCLRKASQITVEAHQAAYRQIKPGLYEYQIEAELEYYFKKQGLTWAYPSIVASGKNATILHYVRNNQVLQAGQLLLIDAGCEYEYYAGDLTRTVPVSGKFTLAQKSIYQIVLKAQKAAISLTKQRNTTLIDIHQEVLKILSEGLLDLGLLQGSLSEVLENKAYRRFYMHGTSHWLGLDVHDPGGNKSDKLEPGMVLTIEPGLYLPVDRADIPSEFRGIGIRIEDDILITKEGSEILTAQMPKETQEIEELITG